MSDQDAERPAFTEWRKASASDATGNCVEVARAGRTVGVRDSKDPSGPVLRVTVDDWRTFTAAVRSGGYA